MTEAKDDKLWSKEQKYESQLTFFDKAICTIVSRVSIFICLKVERSG